MVGLLLTLGVSIVAVVVILIAIAGLLSIGAAFVNLCDDDHISQLKCEDVVGEWRLKDAETSTYSSLVLFEDSTFIANNIYNFRVNIGKDSLLNDGEWKYVVKHQGEGITGKWYVSYCEVDDEWRGTLVADSGLNFKTYKTFKISRLYRYCFIPTDDYEITVVFEGDPYEFFPEKVYRRVK